MGQDMRRAFSVSIAAGISSIVGRTTGRIVVRAALIGLVAASGASAQDAQPTARPRRPVLPTLEAWAPKPETPAPYIAPNRPIWRLSDLLAKHKGQSNWTETLVKTRDFIGQYISMGPGEKTKTVFYADDRVFWFIQSGKIRFNIEGQEPFVATKGFMVEVPFRIPYSMETVGDEPSLRFEVRPPNQAPIYPLSETPTPIPGIKYVKATYTGKGSYDANNKVYVDFYKDVLGAGKSGRLILDDHTGVSAGPAKPVATPPPTDFGHFHESFDEWWFILDGKVNFLIEGVPLFTANQGDVVFAPTGRWHRPTPTGTANGTRIAVIARTGLPNSGTASANLHFYQENVRPGTATRAVSQ
jgi:mannose-6-phosphate isomerase-like protein (cupin superfamily)